MPSITTWTRLEPICREDDVRTGLEARVHDPLWMLGRQWQLNEFKGEDAGSPVTARVKTESHQLTRYIAGPPPAVLMSIAGGIVGRQGERFDPSSMPLETLVEREHVATASEPSVRFAIDAGREFLRFLEAAHATSHRAKFLTDYALALPAGAALAKLDPSSRQLYEASAGRAIDGVRLFRDLSRTPPTEAPLAEAVRSWLAWYRSVYSEPKGDDQAWLDRRMEYRFAVSASTSEGEIVLEAPEYMEGRLDWYDFSVPVNVSLGAKPEEQSTEVLERLLIPTPVSYAGMPAERWWEFEDARIHFGAVDVQPGDLVAAVMLQFAIIYGNDWFVVPVSAKVGSLCDVKSLLVTDSFGVATEVVPFSRNNPNWRMFSLTKTATPPRELFFLPPALAHGSAGSAVEEVLFARDELANLAWAVERLVESPGGSTLDRRWASPPAAEHEALPAGERLRYQLAAEPPENWVPLVPVRDPDSGELRFQRARLRESARGRITGAGSALAIEADEIPRSGVVVTRAPQWTRWIDGSSHLWIGRRKLPGNGEASSGMRFDYLTGPDEP